MRLIDADLIFKFIQDGLTSGKFGNDAVEILTEIQFAPAVEAYTRKEIEAAIKDRNVLCATVRCDRCDYRNLKCSRATVLQIDGLVQTYRKRKEEGKCDNLEGGTK